LLLDASQLTLIFYDAKVGLLDNIGQTWNEVKYDQVQLDSIIVFDWLNFSPCLMFHFSRKTEEI